MRGGGRFLSSCKAFTLSEVLITLGIIGIVAALTMPAIIAKKEKEETVVRLKKIYSVLNNAMIAAVNEHGDMKNWDLDTSSNEGRINILKTYFAPYVNVGKQCDNTNMKSCWETKFNTGGDFYNINGNVAYSVLAVIVLKDGSAFGFVHDAGDPYIVVDINGGKRKPNRLGKDIFALGLDVNNNRIVMFGNNSTRENLINSGSFNEINGGACVKGNKRYDGRSCGALIQKDGWKISEDYPW